MPEFYYRDDFSTSLPGKRDAKKVGKNLLQRPVLNDYLSNLYNKFIAENPSTKLSFSKFARMCPSHFKHTNFATQQSCLCTKHQNMSLKLKALKDLKIVTTTNPDTFVKNLNEADIIQKIANLACEKISFQVWKNVIVKIKSKSGDLKSTKKNKKITEEMPIEEFKDLFIMEIKIFTSHAQRVSKGHAVVHMDFAEDSACDGWKKLRLLTSM